VAEATPNP
jgi:hypothetical protein